MALPQPPGAAHTGKLRLPMPPGAAHTGKLRLPMPPGAAHTGKLRLPMPPSATHTGKLRLPMPPDRPPEVTPTPEVTRGCNRALRRGLGARLRRFATIPAMSLCVAQVRVVPEKGKLQANHDRLMAVLAELPAEVDVVVTPECYLDGYVATEPSVTADDLAQYAIDPGQSAYADAISDWCAARKAWMVFGCTRRHGGRLYNSALVYDRTGILVGCYNKLHCQTHDQKFTAGGALQVFDGDFGRFGVMICADRRWPETVRALAMQGARIIFNPTYGRHDDLNLAMMRTRSFESEVFIAFTHPCQSLVTDPHGAVVCDASDGEAQYCVTQLDLAVASEARLSAFAHLKDRRGDVYGY